MDGAAASFAIAGLPPVPTERAPVASSNPARDSNASQQQ